ncbi:nuclear transport factor 2 family protein [Caulobacter mirabilis]|uniref:Ketosteroid isomerase n=1 Tax=Caulobacter mirabilis TaxID=69666 RepID=A0A2D2AWZ9_9CAUL|nr:nuclear transport factor 2 family protein [Caulobacter mirabilis]ATQ42501.1 ketosteroid isomerase [Caulobacter mirabilis]
MSAAEPVRLATLAAAQRYVDAWVAGDFPAMMAAYSDDFVLHWFGQNPFARTYEGREAAIGALMEFTRRTGRRLLAVVDVMAGAERATVIVREQITVGEETREIERTLVYRVANDQLAECWVYDQDQRFIDRALSA